MFKEEEDKSIKNVIKSGVSTGEGKDLQRKLN